MAVDLSPEIRVHPGTPRLALAASSTTVTPAPPPTPPRAPTSGATMESPRIVGVRVLDGDHVVVHVQALRLAGGAKIVVRTHKTFESSAIDGRAAAITDDAWVQRRLRCLLLA